MKPEASRVMHIIMPLRREIASSSGACALEQYPPCTWQPKRFLMLQCVMLNEVKTAICKTDAT